MGRSERRLSLRTKLVLASCAVGLAMLGFVFAVVGPVAERAFTTHGAALLDAGADRMRALARSDSAAGRQVLEDVIRHNLDARRRHMLDLPASLYGGDVARFRTAVLEQDERRTVRLQRNVDVLMREMDLRADARIDRHIEQLREQQAARATAFGRELRRTHLWLVGGVLVVLLLLLGFGLDRAVVSPLRELRRATRAIADGDLGVDVGVATGDEVGALASDFRRMVAHLRVARADLEAEHGRTSRDLEGARADLQRTAAQLQRADRLASIGTLAGGIAHEFNNLIGGIRGCVTDALEDERDASHREVFEVVLRATDRAQVITGKLLSFARPRIAKRETVDVADVVSEVLDLVDAEARRQGVAVVRDLPDGLEATVDTGGLHQVFLNLLSNAIASMPQGGTLTVAAASDQDTLRIRVADTGVGIPPGDLEHVFDPFYTSRDRATDPLQRGTGLGLSVSYGIVEAHGGVIEVRSEVGRGTTFTVVLPRDHKESAGES